MPLLPLSFSEGLVPSRSGVIGAIAFLVINLSFHGKVKPSYVVDRYYVTTEDFYVLHVIHFPRHNSCVYMNLMHLNDLKVLKAFWRDSRE